MARRIDLEELISYSDDLIKVFKNENDINCLNLSVEQSDGLSSRCRSDHLALQTSLEDYHKKIEICKEKLQVAEAEVGSDEEIHLLQKELDEEIQKEALLLQDIRTITSQIKDMDEQRNLVEERWRFLKKLEEDEMKNMAKLSMYASVTKIIPELNEQNMISGHIVDKPKQVVEKFEFSSQDMSDFDTCNAIWKMIS